MEFFQHHLYSTVQNGGNTVYSVHSVHSVQCTLYNVHKGACTLLLPSWVSSKDSSLPEGGGEISIEKLETQLNTLKTMFAEKQKLVNDLEAYGPAGKKIKGRIEQTCFNQTF